MLSTEKPALLKEVGHKGSLRVTGAFCIGLDVHTLLSHIMPAPSTENIVFAWKYGAFCEFNPLSQHHSTQ